MKLKLLIFALVISQPLFSQPDMHKLIENYSSDNLTVSTSEKLHSSTKCSNTEITKTQKSEIPHKKEAYFLQSGKKNYSFNKQGKYYIAYKTVIDAGKQTPWLRVYFDDAYLGSSSYILLESLKDGASQKIDSKAFKNWNKSSAYFNGAKLKLSLYVAKEDKDVYFKINSLMKGEFQQSLYSIKSICDNADDRISTNDPAVGRIVPNGCTGWIADNGAHISAGHCFAAPGADMLEFNVPPSLANGTIQHPAPEHQYVIDRNCLHFSNNGHGDDWAVFSVADNPITGQQPRQAQGAAYTVNRLANPANIRITGYGVDGPAPNFGAVFSPRNADNQTLQTDIGPNSGANGTTLNYRTDTQGGNSGSPVIDPTTNNAIGVHTHGGCGNGGGNNHGTSAIHNNFWNSIQLCAMSTVGSQLNGDSNICNDETTNYTLSNPGNLPVTWQTSSNLSVVNSNNTSVTVRGASSTRSSGFVRAIVDGQQINRNLWVGRPASPTSLYGPSTVRYGAIVRYSGSSVQGATSYKWYLPYPYNNNATVTVNPRRWGILSGGNSRYLNAIVGPNNGYVQFMGTNQCGTGGARYIRVTVSTTGGGGGIP